MTMVYSQGLFGGLSIEMFTMESAMAQNSVFYGKEGIKTSDILSKDGAVELPPDTQMVDIYKKMELLSNGENWTPTEEDVTRSRHFAEEVQRKSDAFVSSMSSRNLDASGKNNQ
jgi:hypothetical protein